MTIREAFLTGMSRAAQTVNVVTTDGPAGRAGVTVSAMASVSADATHPTLLVCIHHSTQAAPRIITNGTFCVNVLRDDQAQIADAFAGLLRDRLADRFDVASWAPMPLGSPRVVDPLVAFDCQVSQQTRIGTHHVFMGEVQSVFVAPRGKPLLYAHRAYGSPTPLETGTPRVAGLTLASLTGFGALVLPGLLTSEPVEVIEGDQARVLAALHAGEVELAVLLDHDLPPDIAKTPLLNLYPHILLPPRHESSNLSALQHLPLILLNTPPFAGLVRDLLRGAGVTPQTILRAHSVEMVRAMVAQGLGASMLFLPKPSATGAAPLRLVLAHCGPLSPAADQLIQRAQSRIA